MTPLECVNREAMVLAGAAIAIQIAQTSTEAELLTLAAFFTILGDNLAMVATSGPTSPASNASVKIL